MLQGCRSLLSTNSGNFKFVVIIGNGVHALRMVCLQDTDYLKSAKDNQEIVYHSVHMYATIEYCNNNLKSLVMYPNWGTSRSN